MWCSDSTEICQRDLLLLGLREGKLACKQFHTIQARLQVPSNSDCSDEIPKSNRADLSTPKKLINKAPVAYILGSFSVQDFWGRTQLYDFDLAQFSQN